MDPSEALSSLGNPWSNLWQMAMYNLIIGPMGMIGAWQIMAIVFIGEEPKHRCRLPVAVLMNESTPYRYTDEVRRFDSCVVFENYSSATNRTVPCQLGWVYEHDTITITEQWDLVCDKNYWTETTQTVLVLGVLVGAITMTGVADKFGRKRTFLMNACAGSFVVFLTAWVNNYYLFTALRFLLGIFNEGTSISGYVLANELFPAKRRTTAGVMAWIYWPLGMVTLAVIGFFFRNWRHLLIVTSLPGLLFVPLFWILPESIPWLIAKNRTDDAKQILQAAAKCNNIELPKKYRYCSKMATSSVDVVTSGNEAIRVNSFETNVSQTTESNSQEFTLVDIMNSSTLRLYSFVLFYLWFVLCLVYYGLTLTSGTLAGNKYVNFSLSGAVEIPATILCIPLYNRIGRRWPTSVLLITAGLSLLISLVTPQTTGANFSLLSVVLNMIGKFSISATFGGVSLYNLELYPTTVRTVGLGLGSVGGRLGNMLAPYSTYFTRLAPWFPGAVFGTLSLIGGIITLLLPETRGLPLPQTIVEIENRVVTSGDKESIA